MEGRTGTLIVCGFAAMLFYIAALGLIFAMALPYARSMCYNAHNQQFSNKKMTNNITY